MLPDPRVLSFLVSSTNGATGSDSDIRQDWIVGLNRTAAIKAPIVTSDEWVARSPSCSLDDSMVYMENAL